MSILFIVVDVVVVMVQHIFGFSPRASARFIVPVPSSEVPYSSGPAMRRFREYSEGI